MTAVPELVREALEIKKHVRFSQEAQRVLGLAVEEARNFKRSLVDTEHILLALIKHGTFGQVLPENIDGNNSFYQTAFQAVEEVVGHGSLAAGEPTQYSGSAVALFDIAETQARLHRQPEVRGVDLLTALLTMNQGNAGDVMESMMIDRHSLLQKVQVLVA